MPPEITVIIEQPLDWVSGIVVPLVAIVVSVVIAVLIAKSDRKSARVARDVERRDRIVEDILTTLAFFVSVNPQAETWAGEMRTLRSRIIILQTLPDPSSRLLGEWLAGEQPRGFGKLEDAMSELRDGMSVNQVIDVLAPVHSWAHETIMGIATWMRGGVSDEILEKAIAAQSSPAPDASSSP